MNFEAEQDCFFPSQIDSNSSLASSLLTKRLKANCFKMGNRNTTLAKKQTKTKQNKEKKKKKKIPKQIYGDWQYNESSLFL